MGMYDEMKAVLADHGGMPDLLPDDEFDCCVRLCADVANKHLKQELASQAARFQATIDSMADQIEDLRAEQELAP